MASERQDRLRALVLAACEDLGRYGLEPTPEAVAAVASLVVNASRLGAEVDAAAEIARLRAIIEADGLDPDAPMPPGLTVVNERLRRKLKEAWRERSAARAEALTAQASLRRVERELEEARERERGYRHVLISLTSDEEAGIASTEYGEYCVYCSRESGDLGPALIHEDDCPVKAGRRVLAATPDTEGET